MKPSGSKKRQRFMAPAEAATTSEPMAWPEIFHAFERYDEIYQRDAVDAAVARREEITPRLVSVIEKVRDDPLTFSGMRDFFAHEYACVLLGYFREQRAHVPIVELFGLPGDVTNRLFGDLITEELPWILYATRNDAGAGIESLALKTDAYEFCRTAAIIALTYLVADGTRDRDEMLAFFRGLFTGEEAEPGSFFWSGVADAVCSLCPAGMMDVIEKAYEDRLIDPFFIDYGNFEEALGRGEEACLEGVRRELELKQGSDVHGHMAWWSCFDREDEHSSARTKTGAPDGRMKASKRKNKRNAQRAARKRNRR